MNFMNIDSFTINNNPQDIQTETHTVNNNRNKALNFIFNSNYKLFQKDSQESETNSQLNIPSYKREILFKLTSFSQGRQNVVFSNGIEEIFDDGKNDGDEKFLKIFQIKNLILLQEQLNHLIKRLKII